MISERIKKYIDYKNISLYAFENSIEASRGSISKMVNEKRGIGSSVLEKILITYSDLNPEWLVTGKGSMLRSETSNNVSSSYEEGTQNNTDTTENIYKSILEINKRVYLLIKRLSVTPYEFSKKLGNKMPTNIYNIINGKVSVSKKTIEKIFSAYPEVNPEWLLTGRGEMLKEDECDHETSDNMPDTLREPEFTYKKSTKNIKNLQASNQTLVLKERLADRDSLIQELKDRIQRIEVDKEEREESLQSQIQELKANMQMMLASKDQMLSMKDEVIKLKEEALKRNQEIIKEKDDFIDTQKAYIENLKKKESIIDFGKIPHSKKITLVKKGNLTEITETKKGWPDGRNADIPLPTQQS